MPTDPRVHVTFRLGQKGVDWIDRLAQDEHTTRARVIRAALAVARAHISEVTATLKKWKDEQ
jgi:predicted transcriptional regulator